MPGKARTLLIWFGKSLRPVEITAAPPAFASSGKISGVGFAQAKMIAFSFMVWTISFVTMPGAETPTKISAPFKASAKVPEAFFKLVTFAISFCIQFKFSESFEMIPLISHIVMSLKP